MRCIHATVPQFATELNDIPQLRSRCEAGTGCDAASPPLKNNRKTQQWRTPVRCNTPGCPRVTLGYVLSDFVGGDELRGG